MRTQTAVSACSHTWPGASQDQALTGCCVSELSNHHGRPQRGTERLGKDVVGEVPRDEAERSLTADGMTEDGEGGERKKSLNESANGTSVSHKNRTRRTLGSVGLISAG